VLVLFDTARQQKTIWFRQCGGRLAAQRTPTSNKQRGSAAPSNDRPTISLLSPTLASVCHHLPRILSPRRSFIPLHLLLSTSPHRPAGAWQQLATGKSRVLYRPTPSGIHTPVCSLSHASANCTIYHYCTAFFLLLIVGYIILPLFSSSFLCHSYFASLIYVYIHLCWLFGSCYFTYRLYAAFRWQQ